MKGNSINYRLPNRWTVMFSLFLIVLGILFLAFNIGLLNSDWRQVFVSWQMVMIVVAIILLFHRQLFKGLILLSLSAFFIVPRLAVASPDAFWWVKDDFTHDYSPIFLMIAGILILLHAVFRRKKRMKKIRQKNHYYTTTKTENYQKKSTKHAHSEQDIAFENVKQNVDFESEKTEKTKKRQQKEKTSRSIFERSSIFRSISEIIHELEFEGGTMNALFGNITLDLRNTTIPDNICELNVNVIFGGITILVPETWNVEVHLNSIFGNLQDSRARSNEAEKTHTLIIHGICIFGSGEIKN